ncbi:MAG: hypothetical protein WBF53_11840 [Litorimonas sp.]
MQVPRVILKEDTLDRRNAEFEQAPLRDTLFLNSIPKSGSHLMKNIMRMFVPVAQQYKADFIQYPNLQQHHHALMARPALMSWGHLLFADNSSKLLRNARHILLVRDPYDWVLARARFFLSENFQAGLDDIKSGRVAVEDFINMMIFGVHGRFPNMHEIYLNNAVAWLGTQAQVVHYETLIRNVLDLDGDAADKFFGDLLETAGIDRPRDWRERVRAGSDRSQSGTARENLDLQDISLPARLSDTQRKLVDFASPGLRGLLGYS